MVNSVDLKLKFSGIEKLNTKKLRICAKVIYSGLQQTQNFETSLENFYAKMGYFDILTQNSILIKFDMDFIIEILNLEFLKKIQNISTS